MSVDVQDVPDGLPRDAPHGPPGGGAPQGSSEDTSGGILAFPAIRRFLVGRSLSSLAFQMQAVAVGWQVYTLTHSKLALGLVGLAQFLPMVCLVFVAGHAADRYDRKHVAALCQSVQAAAVLTLAVTSLLHVLPVAGIYALVAVIGATRCFEGPSMSSLLPQLVPQAVFTRAAAASSSAMQTATIVGPALGGLLYVAGPGATYFACAACLAVAAAATGSIHRIAPPRPQEPPSLRAVFSGIAFLRAHRDILGAISLDLFAVLLGGATALLPVYARDILHTGPWGLGLLRAGPAVGALLTSLVLARRPIQRRAGRKMFAAVALFGLATILFGLSRNMAVSVAALVLLGASDVVSVVVRSSLVQLRTPDAMRGRVSAVNMLFIGTSNQFGEFESGTTAALLGTVPAVVLGGAGTLLVAALWMWRFPGLRRLDRLE